MPEKPKIKLSLFSSTRQSISPDFKSLVTVSNGLHQLVHREFHTGQPPVFEVDFFDNFGDDYTVLVAAKKHHDAGFFPVKVALGLTQQVDLMLLPKKNRYNFSEATWEKLKLADPALVQIFVRGAASETEARGFYEELLDGTDRQQDAIATLHNITTALHAVELPVGKPLDYFKQLIWEGQPPQRDRFFAFADEMLVEQIKQARAHGTWVNAPAVTHPGATSAFKQVQFGEANVELAFHEQDRRDIDGVSCVKIEADIDYFKDPLAHFLLELIPNAITHNQTDPKIVYLLRWIAGRHAGVPEFNPPYTLEIASN
ncbi:MAG: hypothetical protein JST84_10810 [Acidobacteria bacterium]|nr:hypothetical protein [Acidobacteriota bacterium]